MTDKHSARFFAIEEMAGSDGEGESLVSKPSDGLEKSRNSDTREKETSKQKKAGPPREERTTANSQPSSSKTTVTKTDFVESIKASISESMVEGFRQISKSLSTDIAGMLSSTARPPSKRTARESESDSELESDENAPVRKRQRTAPDSESVDLSIDEQVDSLFTKDSSKAKENQKTKESVENDFLGSIAAEYDLDEACSADVDAKLAKIVNKMVRTKLSDEKLKEKLLTCTRPTNCENVTGTKVNPEVWSKIKSNTRSRDLKFQRLQNVVQKAMIPLIKLTDQCMKPEVSSLQLSGENVARTLLDVIALLGHANCELIQRRRDMIKPDLNNQYQQICAEHVGFTDLLFGNDLPKQIQDISATNRMGQKLQSSHKANENYHRKSQFPKNGQTHRPHFNSRGQRYHKTQTPFRKRQEKVEQKQ